MVETLYAATCSLVRTGQSSVSFGGRGGLLLEMVSGAFYLKMQLNDALIAFGVNNVLFVAGLLLPIGLHINVRGQNNITR